MSLRSSLYDFVVLRPARNYAKFVLRDRPADSVMQFLCAPHFFKIHRYRPHFDQPRSYSEKIWHRMLFDRDPIWTLLSDKLGMRKYVADKGEAEYLIPLLWSGDDPEAIPFQTLPERFVIKATHGCAYNVIVREKASLEIAETQRQLRRWLSENYCIDSFLGVEWGYKHVKPSIMIESFLEENLIDYKFRTFGGKVEFFTAHFGRSGHQSESLVCDRDGTPVGCTLGHRYAGDFSPPGNLPEMIELAEQLGRDFDFMRVDLYSTDNRIYFGELTPYPGAGCIPFKPGKFDFYFGSKWKQRDAGKESGRPRQKFSSAHL